METIQTRLADRDMLDRILPRFLAYTRFWTTSDRHVAETPSTPGQWELAKALEKELRGLGIKDVVLTDHCYVLARIPGTAAAAQAPTIGFMAHMDTSSDVSGKDVQAKVLKDYDGKAIRLNADLVLDPENDSDLAERRGDTIVHTDGATLLGADDKAGISEIMAAVEYLSAHPEIDHGPLEIVFSPDEETGKGLPEFPRELIKSQAFYTLDGGPGGELEVECFTAYKADVLFKGKVIHIGAARGRLANAVLMASSFATMLPRSESPEATDGYYGYYCPMEIKGTLESASLEVYIRDFDQRDAERRIEHLERFARAVEAQFPGGSVAVAPQLQYLNMKKKIDAQPRVFDLLEKAARAAGVETYRKPIRGGTDGSRLTEMGIPTPNIFTGGRNYHSRTEWVSVSDMVAAARTIVELISLWSKERTKA